MSLTLAILGFLSVLVLLATAITFVYVLGQMLSVLNFLRAATQMLFGLNIGEPGKESKAAGSGKGFVKMDPLWDDEKEGRD